ncbi:MAG: hypothetical protein H0T79_24265 [Deltaproteobacteria bacterium]|nr:hypothetical protein [Deltaproteobacteria bacterium]
MAPDDDPIKVKQLLEWAASRVVGGNTEPAPDLDPATAAELQRWFGLPSFAEAKEQGIAVPEDPETVRAREQRATALAAIDPAFLEAHRARIERCDTMIKLVPHVDIHVEDEVALMDYSMVDRGHSIAEPRDIELPPELQDDLKDCTPQALLRDLHRSETEFDKQFEVIDVAAELKIDIVKVVDEAMKADWTLPAFGKNPFIEGQKLLADARALRSSPWTDIPMPNRRTKD